MFLVIILVATIAISIAVNKSEICDGDFDARNWLTIMACLYSGDFLLISTQMRFLKRTRSENLCVTFLRFLMLITVVTFMIIGNIGYYNKRDPRSCPSTNTIALVILIYGYFEMLKCCCIGCLLCILIPLLMMAQRNA